MEKPKKNLPLILVILDGWGIAPVDSGNSVTLSQLPIFNSLGVKYPHTKLFAHGKYVGLPEDQVGNSEAGHMNIGAGRLVEQDGVRVIKSIKDKTFFKNPAFLGAVRHIHSMKSRVHVMGLISNGQSPHSDPQHLQALLELLKKNKVEKPILHLFTDGRDSPKYASLKLIDDLEKTFSNGERIATIAGRFYAMDRKKKWERTEKTYNALTLGEALKSDSAQEAIIETYNKGESDEFIEPYVIGADYEDTRIKTGDSVIFFNLRSDRSRQLAKAFVQPDFEERNDQSFVRKNKIGHLYFVAMTDFGPDLNEILIAFPGVDLSAALPVILGDLRQLYLAETEKYAHVTYFFNGGYSGAVADEKQQFVSSPDVKSYDLTPEMSSKQLTDIILNNFKDVDGKSVCDYDFTTLNFAAPDMVGHTGNLKAGIQCCEAVDKYLGQIIEAYQKASGVIVVTADHGNIEKMINQETGEIYTEHTTNLVPFIVIGADNINLRANGSLCDIAPTILELLDRKKPREMKGKSLIV